MVKEGYKETEVGVIPNDWKCCVLSELLSVGHGRDQKQIVNENGKYPILATGGIIGFTNEYLWDKPSALIGRKGTINKPQYVETPFWSIDTLFFTKIFDCACPKYIFYLFCTINWLSMNEASGVPSLSATNIEKILCAIPPLSEQQKIAETLSDMDNLISSLEKLIEKKKAIKQGAMQELLTGKKRLAGFNGEWHNIALGECCEIYDGTHQTPNYTEYGVPFYSVENVTADDFVNTKYISFEEHEFLSKNRCIEKDDVLMTRIGSIGQCKYIDWDVNASFYVSLALIKCKKKIYGQFLSYYSNTDKFKKEIEIRSLLTAIPQKINLGPISEIVINVPMDIDEQKAITEIISDMDDEIEKLEKKLEKCKKIKQGMMQELLTGKIRLI